MKKAAAIRALNARELELGIAGTSASWHADYATSTVVRIDGVPNDISDEALISIFEQYGAAEHLHVPRDGEGRAFVAFLGYADARSAMLAVDNLNGIKIGERTISVDHVHVNNYTYTPNSRYNVRVEQPEAQHEQNTAGGTLLGSAVTAGTSGVSEEEVMARLRAMRKQREAEEREARAGEDDGGSGAGGNYIVGMKRVRSKADKESRVVPEGRHADKNAHARKRPGGKEEEVGSKEARRLERAAIREERRRRRARRVAQGTAMDVVGSMGVSGSDRVVE